MNRKLSTPLGKQSGLEECWEFTPLCSRRSSLILLTGIHQTILFTKQRPRTGKNASPVHTSETNPSTRSKHQTRQRKHQHIYFSSLLCRTARKRKRLSCCLVAREWVRFIPVHAWIFRVRVRVVCLRCVTGINQFRSFPWVRGTLKHFIKSGQKLHELSHIAQGRSLTVVRHKIRKFNLYQLLSASSVP